MKHQLHRTIAVLFKTFLSSVFSTNSTGDAALTNEEQAKHAPFFFFFFNQYLTYYLSTLFTPCAHWIVATFPIGLAISLFGEEYSSLHSTYKLENYTSCPESMIELYQPSSLRLSAKLVSTFVDRGCHVVSMTDPYLIFLTGAASVSSK
jgi:hypothetical protein